jgi:hypothetical protein
VTQPCANACTRINADGNREPSRAEYGQLCRNCLDRLDRSLEEIPQRYALLPDYLLPTADLDRNPESKATKQPTAPIPIRLATLDLLDERRTRRWLGTIPGDERRGTLGTLMTIANKLRATRNSPPRVTSWVMTEADYLRTGLEAFAALDTVVDDYRTIKRLHRELGDAIGQYPPRPVGRCKVVYDDIAHDHEHCSCACHHDDETWCDTWDTRTPPDDLSDPAVACGPVWAERNACGGPLLPGASGVYCATCGTRWDTHALRLLGEQLGTPA